MTRGRRWFGRGSSRSQMACHDVTLASVAEDLALDEAILIEADEGRGPAGGPILGTSGLRGRPRRLAPVARRSSDRGLPGRWSTDPPPIQWRRDRGHRSRCSQCGGRSCPRRRPQDFRRWTRPSPMWSSGSPGRSGRTGRPVTVLGHGDLAIGDRKCGGGATPAEAMVHGPLLDPLPVPDRADRPLSRDPPRQPAYRHGRTHHEFVTNLDLPRQALIDSIRGVGFPARTHFRHSTVRSSLCHH